MTRNQVHYQKVHINTDDDSQMCHSGALSAQLANSSTINLNAFSPCSQADHSSPTSSNCLLLLHCWRRALQIFYLRRMTFGLPPETRELLPPPWRECFNLEEQQTHGELQSLKTYPQTKWFHVDLLTPDCLHLSNHSQGIQDYDLILFLFNVVVIYINGKNEWYCRKTNSMFFLFP